MTTLTLPSPGGRGCCPFQGSGSVVVYSLFTVPSIFGEGLCLVFGLLCIILGPFYFCHHLDKEERAMASLLLPSYCLVIVSVLWLFLVVPWDSLQCVFWYFLIILTDNIR